MATAMTLQCPVKLADDYRRDLMIQYALTAYKYVITVTEADEIFSEPYWEDVDNFCAYMQEVNFGESIPDTTNVVLPSTMRIYTDEELDLMNAGTFVEDPDIRVEPTSFTLDACGDDAETDYESDITHVDLGADAILQRVDNEALPLYTDPPPAYTVSDEVTANELVESTPIVTEVEVEVEVDGHVPTAVEVVDNDPKAVEQVFFRTLGARLDRKLLKMKQKLVRGFKSCSPRRVVDRAREARGTLFRR